MSNLNKKQKIGFVLVIFMATVLIVAAFVFLKLKGVQASESVDLGKITWQTKLDEDVDGDGKVEEIYLTSYNNNGKRRSVISTRINTFRYRQNNLLGFEEDIAYCPQKYFKLADGEVALCIFGIVGVHSQNIQIVRFRDFSTVDFYDKEGVKNLNMTSDAPYFDFNYGGLDNFTIFFDNRNYDKNPLVDTIRTHYYLDSSVFRYYDTESLSMEGLIK